MGFDPNQPRNKDGEWTKGGGSPNRWSRMNSTARAKLTASAQFSTSTKSGKVGKLPKLGATSPKMLSTPFKPSEPSAHAVAIQTAKALDKDFRTARDKSNKAAMKDALSKTAVPVIKYPEGKRKKIK